MNAMQKAITQLQKKCTPIKDENDFEYYATNNIVFAMDIAIKEAKQEVFDDIDKILHPYKNKPEPKGYPLDSYSHKEYEDLKQRHLSTLPKAKELNSDYEVTPKVCSRCNNRQCIAVFDKGKFRKMIDCPDCSGKPIS